MLLCRLKPRSIYFICIRHTNNKIDHLHKLRLKKVLKLSLLKYESDSNRRFFVCHVCPDIFYCWYCCAEVDYLVALDTFWSHTSIVLFPSLTKPPLPHAYKRIEAYLKKKSYLAMFYNELIQFLNK